VTLQHLENAGPSGTVAPWTGPYELKGGPQSAHRTPFSGILAVVLADIDETEAPFNSIEVHRNAPAIEAAAIASYDAVHRFVGPMVILDPVAPGPPRLPHIFNSTRQS
jgi:hypothetical protein